MWCDSVFIEMKCDVWTALQRKIRRISFQLRLPIIQSKTRWFPLNGVSQNRIVSSENVSAEEMATVRPVVYAPPPIRRPAGDENRPTFGGYTVQPLTGGTPLSVPAGTGAALINYVNAHRRRGALETVSFEKENAADQWEARALLLEAEAKVARQNANYLYTRKRGIDKKIGELMGEEHKAEAFLRKRRYKIVPYYPY